MELSQRSSFHLCRLREKIALQYLPFCPSSGAPLNVSSNRPPLPTCPLGLVTCIWRCHRRVCMGSIAIQGTSEVSSGQPQELEGAGSRYRQPSWVSTFIRRTGRLDLLLRTSEGFPVSSNSKHGLYAG